MKEENKDFSFEVCQMDGRFYAQGIYILNTVQFNYKIHDTQGGKYPYRLRMSVVSPEDGKILQYNGKKREAILNKLSPEKLEIYQSGKALPELYVQTEGFLTENTEQAVKEKVVSCAQKLYQENGMLIQSVCKNRQKNDMTPNEAYVSFGNGFLSTERAVSERTLKRKRSDLKAACCVFACTPMRSVSVEMAKTAYKQLGSTAEAKFRILCRFWKYCQNEKLVYRGINPIEEYLNGNVSRKKKKVSILIRNAMKSKQLNETQEQALYELCLSRFRDGRYMSAALINGAGITGSRARALLWKDIAFNNEIQGFAYITQQDDERSGATHNYSRPVFLPESALLQKRLEYLKTKYCEKEIMKMPVVSESNDPLKSMQQKDVSAFLKGVVREIRVNAALTAPETYGGKSSGGVGTMLLLSNYRSRLMECGLSNEPGMLAFLQGHSIPDVTSDNYRSFTDAAGKRQIMLYMRRLNRVKYESVEASDEPAVKQDGGNTTIAYKRTEQGCVRTASVTLRLNPGQEVTVFSAYGVQGQVKVHGLSRNGTKSPLKDAKDMAV